MGHGRLVARVVHVVVAAVVEQPPQRVVLEVHVERLPCLVGSCIAFGEGLDRCRCGERPCAAQRVGQRGRVELCGENATMPRT